jgi:Cu-processing system ATP-binding protein
MTALLEVRLPGGHAARSTTGRTDSPMVAIQGLVKRFRQRTVLDGVDLAIGRGRITAVLGPNASGKSTLIKVILGLVKADAGEVTVDGTRVNGDPTYRSRIGYMPQAARFSR